MKSLSMILAAITVGSSVFIAHADDRPYSERDFTACVTLEAAHGMLIQERNQIDDWLDRNRGRSLTGSALNNFNSQVGAYNALNDMVGEFEGHINRNCNEGLKRYIYENVCKSSTGRMNAFIRDGAGCANWRKYYGD